MSLNSTPSVAPAVAPDVVAPVVAPDVVAPAARELKGELSPEILSNLGLFIGKGGSSLKKYVTGKSSYQISKAYEQDFNPDWTCHSTPPSELGPIMVRVVIDDKVSPGEKGNFTITIRNDKEDLSEYLSIVKGNLDKHADNFSKKKPREDTYSQKIVFVTNLENEGLIGKFVGSKGKNIRALSENICSTMGVENCFITIDPEGPKMVRGPWKNKVIRIESSKDFTCSVNIVVSLNLPGGRNADYNSSLRMLTPLISESVDNLAAKSYSNNEVSANNFMDNWTAPESTPASPRYSNEEGW